MNLVQAFILFGRNKNLNQVAKLLGISQPALSRQLMQFERDLGLSLFSNQGRKKVLSAIGQQVFDKLNSKWVDYNEVFIQLRAEAQNSPVRPIEILGSSDMIGLFAGKINFPFSLHYQFMSSQEVISSLKENKFQIGITKINTNRSDLIQKKLFESRFFIIAPKHWVQRNQLSELGKISNKKIISYSEDFLKSKKLDKLLSKYGVFKSFEIIPNWSALFEKVNAGHGWAIVPEDVFKNKNIIKSTSAITSILIPESIFSSESYYLVYLSSNKHIKWFHEIITTIQSVRA